MTLELARVRHVAERSGDGGAANVTSTRLTRASAQDVDRLDEHESSLAEQRDAVGDVLDLGKDVRGEQDGAAVGSGLVDERVEGALHQRVEPVGRLVQDEEVGPVHERLDEADLLSVALRQGGDRPVELELEALRERRRVTESAHAARGWRSR